MGDGAGTRHDLLAQDGSASGSRLTCANCHEPHTSSAATPCVDPDSPTTTHTLSASGVTLCLRCHDDALPTSAETSGWAQSPLGEGGTTTTKNIKDVWDTNVHGDGSSDSPSLSGSLGYAKGDALSCASCHDAHGSTNRYALLESVAGTGTSNSADNLTAVPVPGGGWDLRFYCDSCHDLAGAGHSVAVDTSISVGWVDCTRSGCHTHADNGL
jgi:predicted CXXCH cytochrome family protein